MPRIPQLPNDDGSFITGTDLIALYDAETDITKQASVTELDAFLGGDWTAAQTTATPTFTSNAYAVVAGDLGKLLLLSNGGTAGTVNVNTGLGLTAGQRIDLLQTGSGQITVAGSATITSTPGLKFRAQWSAATLLCIASNTYVLYGDLSA